METILVARLASRGAIDSSKLASYLWKIKGFRFIPAGGEFSRVFRDRNVGGISATFSGFLDNYEKDTSTLLLDLPVYDLDAFRLFGRLLKSRIGPNLKVFTIVEQPALFLNDYVAWTTDPALWLAREQSFFDGQLYRVDRFLSDAVSIGEMELSAASQLENEKALMNFAGAPWSSELEKIPAPATLEAWDVNRFYSLPKMKDIYTPEKWRSVTAEFDGPLTRAASVESLEKIDGLMGKYWRYPLKRYPGLAKALDCNAGDLKKARPYAGLDRKKLASLLPADSAAHFGWLRNGFDPFYNSVLDKFDRIATEDAKPECSVITFAYNQEKYIARCIESVAAQKTSRKFEHVIIDDCSTDGTQKIIREYAQKYPHIKPVLFKRKPSTTIDLAFRSCRSRYVALCDGDDFFTDDGKLETQMNFLDSHPDFSMCFHYATVAHEDGSPSRLFPEKGSVKEVQELSDLVRGNCMQTCSVMYRWRFQGGLPTWFNPLLRPADWYWHVLHAEIGKVGFIPKAMSCYWRHGASIYSTADSSDPFEHFRVHGLREMEVFDDLDRHLDGRFHESFSMLATGVLARTILGAQDIENNPMLERAALLFPGFFKDFMGRLPKIKIS